MTIGLSGLASAVSGFMKSIDRGGVWPASAACAA
jgi:hypothetical protein